MFKGPDIMAPDFKPSWVSSNKYRVVTFQSPDVIEICKNTGVYKADKNLSREKSFSSEDFVNCNGNVPIWVFQHPAFKTTEIGCKQWCHMLENFRCEMSVDSLDGFIMIELLLEKQPPVGKAHNGSSLACVIPEIRYEDIQAYYEIKETSNWYFYEVIPKMMAHGDVLFPVQHIFTKEEYKNDNSSTINLIDFKSVEDYYK